jgi:hypothetical protein
MVRGLIVAIPVESKSGEICPGWETIGEASSEAEVIEITEAKGFKVLQEKGTQAVQFGHVPRHTKDAWRVYVEATDNLVEHIVKNS